jgi:hypothetical protein
MFPVQKDIAHALTRGMGWRSREPLKPADEAEGVKPQANAGSPQALAVGSSHGRRSD